MNKYKPLFLIIIISIGIAIIYWNDQRNNTSKELNVLRSMHLEALEDSPFQNTMNLSKRERSDMGLPPNLYNEQMWELTMDPRTGRPMPQRLIKIKENLKESRSMQRGVGDQVNPWIDIGPNTEGGRTRGILFDPNDINNADPNDDYNRVFAGGVAGGLWVNNDITKPDSSWSLVNGMHGSLAVMEVIADPNDPKILYVGTGESYTSGDAVGNGVWKSEDAGATWRQVLGGYDGFSSNNVEGIFYVNDVVARDNGGITELFVAVAPAIYKYSFSPRHAMGYEKYGVYRSVNGGISWQRLNIRTTSGAYKNPNDLEVDSNNNVWLTTTRNIDGSLGGDIYKSTDGVTFNLINTIPDARRTELEISSNDPNLMWVAANVEDEVDLFRSFDGFSSFESMNEPNDPDEGISSSDFARDQAFYNLVIEADSNDNIYVGGIDLFRSLDKGNTWTLLSKWANRPGLQSENVSLVHADQHAIVFNPVNEKQIVFGNDGGVYYTSNISEASTSINAITPRNIGYNTIQFYFGSIDTSIPNDLTVGGGTQDNGTQLSLRTGTESGSFVDYFGGDGGFIEFDEDYLIQSYYYNDHNYLDYPIFSDFYSITTVEEENEDFNGSFINVAALDKSLDILYSNASNKEEFRLERVSNFKDGEDNIDSKFLTHSLLTSSPSALKVSPFDTSISNLFVGTRTGNLLRAKMADISPIWSDITGSGFVGSISDIEFGVTVDEIFVTMHNYGVKSIWFTSDAGVSWRSIEGDLPDLPVKCILQNPLQPKELIIGTELGVWFCSDYTDPSPKWTHSYNGMSDVTVVDLDLRPSDNLVLASTHGRGMFTSNFTSQSLSLETNRGNRFRLYPTVTKGNITIRSKEQLENAKITIIDINGRVVKEMDVALSRHGVNLNFDLIGGLYFVNILVDNYLETKRLVFH